MPTWDFFSLPCFLSTRKTLNGERYTKDMVLQLLRTDYLIEDPLDYIQHMQEMQGLPEKQHRTPFLSKPLWLILLINRNLQTKKRGEKLSFYNLSPQVARRGIEHD